MDDPMAETRRSPIDAQVGDRVSRARVFRDLSLDELAAKTEMTASALQLREAGMARFSAKELLRIAQCLNVEVSFFFEGLTRKRQSQSEHPQLNAAVSNAEPPRFAPLPRFGVGARRSVVARV